MNCKLHCIVSTLMKFIYYYIFFRFLCVWIHAVYNYDYTDNQTNKKQCFDLENDPPLLHRLIKFTQNICDS